MDLHGLKDIVAIYTSGKDGKPDYSWDRAKIKVWNPAEQREMDLVFTGSNRGDENTPSELRTIHFNVNYTDEGKDVFEAFDIALKKIFPNIEDATLKEYRKVFLQELLNIRNAGYVC